MKKITLALLLLAFANAFGQNTVIYNTVFPAGPAPVGWTTEILSGDDVDDYNWYFGEYVLPGSTSFSAPAAVFNDDIAFSETYNEVVLNSPVFNLSAYTSVFLSFEYGLNSINNTETLTVEVFNGGQWIPVLIVNEVTPPTFTEPIDVTEYLSEYFQIRYTYHDGNSQSMGAGVTNFKLEGKYDELPNDDVSGAIALLCGFSGTGTTIEATAETDLPICNNIDGNTKGAWYKFSNLQNQSSVTVSLCATATDFDSRLSIFKGEPDALTCVTANDNSCENLSSATFHNDGVSTYYILVSGEGETTSNFTISLTCASIAPLNDDIINAIDVDQFEQPYTDYAVPLTNATIEADALDFAETGCDIGSWQQNVFYKFTATSSGEVAISLGTPNPGGFSLIMFYEAPDENATIADLVWVDQETNACNAMSDYRTINTVAGTTYYIVLYMPDTNSDVTIDISTALLSSNENTLKGFSFYPNPVADILHITAAEPIEKLILYNMLGQKVKEYNPDALNLGLDVNGIATGSYILKATVNNQIGTYKFLKK